MNTLRLFLILFCCIWAFNAHSISLVDSLHKEALSLFGDGQHEAALKIFEKNLTLQKNDTTKETEFWTRTYRNTGLCLLKLHRYQKAEEYLNKAIDEYLLIIKEEASPKNYNRLGVCFENRSLAIMHSGEFEKAIYDAQEAILLFRKADKKVNEIRALGILANIYDVTKNFNLAKEKCFNALKRSQEIEGFSDKLLADIYHTLALVYKNEGKDYDESAKYYAKAIAFTKDSTALAGTLNNLANVYLENKNFSKSEDYLNQAIQLKQQVQKHRPYDFFYATTYENFGDLEIAKQNPEDALKYYQKSIINLTNNFRT